MTFLLTLTELIYINSNRFLFKLNVRLSVEIKPLDEAELAAASLKNFCDNEINLYNQLRRLFAVHFIYSLPSIRFHKQEHISRIKCRVILQQIIYRVLNCESHCFHDREAFRVGIRAAWNYRG